QVKLIDFGLAMKRTGRETLLATSATLTGSSIAGTLDYAAPEQMGKLPGVPVRPASDVYGFGKTCCYALFQTPQPLLRHWRSVPDHLAELLESCLEDRPEQRPQDFGAVLARLGGAEPPAPAPPPVAFSATAAEGGGPRGGAGRGAAGTRCPPLARSRTRTVFGVGPLDPDLMFVGEAPGADEDRSGEPFVGAAGKLFNGLLAEAGLQRSQVYITTLL